MTGGRDNRGDGDQALVDESLIDAMLGLSPEERLRLNDRMIRTVTLLRHGLTERPEGLATKGQGDGRDG
jgi:nitrous oxidase accessory protein NosD